jgi:hypothetical protein
MMRREQRPGTGVFFVYQKTTDRQPDYKGELVLDRDYGKGSVIKIAGWKKTTPKNHLISISIDQRPAANNVFPKPTIREDDDVPF